MTEEAVTAISREATSSRLLTPATDIKTILPLQKSHKKMNSKLNDSDDREMTARDSTVEEESVSTDGNQEKEEPEESNQCPLFMTGLPSDFSSNPHLMALAALIDDDETTEEKSRKFSPASCRPKMPAGKAGGGKVRASGRTQQRRKASSSPYPVPEKIPKAKATLGEAQLFLKMWKI
jgi:hypothetical protein